MTSRNINQRRTPIRTLISTSAMVALGALAVSGWSAAAQASDAAEVRQERISYSELDLRTPAGTAALHNRIVAAATRVCPSVYSRELRVIAASQTCRAAAIANAMKEVHGQQVALARAALPPKG